MMAVPVHCVHTHANACAYAHVHSSALPDVVLLLQSMEEATQVDRDERGGKRNFIP